MMTPKIPTLIVVDNFYSDPKFLLDVAHSLPYSKSERSNYPGVRTGDLQQVAPDLFAIFYQKFSDMFRSVNPDGAWEISTQFQRIQANADPELNNGWVHADVDRDIGGIIYLNPVADKSAGTALCSAINPETQPNPNANLKFRNAYYGGRNRISDEDFITAKRLHNARFEDTLVASNRFNRLVAFDSSHPHRQMGFGQFTEPRLTQVFFATIIK